MRLFLLAPSLLDPYFPPPVDNKAVSNVFVTDVLARAHRALDEFKNRAETEDALREVLSDITMHIVRSVHRISVEVSYVEVLNRELAAVRGNLNSLSQPAASSSGSA